MNQDTDGALVARLWAGELTALGVIYDRYGDLVYAMALKGLGQTAEAEDLTQEVFLSLVQRRSYSPQRGSLASYLTTVTRSRVIDRLRAQTTQKKYLSRWHRDQITVESATPMHHLTQQEQRTLVRQALGHLKDRQRQVLEMSYYQGQSHRDIARELGVPLGTVKSWARRGLLQLRRQLDRLQGEQP